jgi:hypothetical protein
VQDSSILDRTGRELNLWTRHPSGSRKTSSDGQRELETSSIKAEKLCPNRRRELRFQVDDFVYLEVSPRRALHRFKIRGKIAPRYIGPFKILEQRGEVAYQLELPPQLSNVHDVFHVSQLRKCLRVPEK